MYYKILGRTGASISKLAREGVSKKVMSNLRPGRYNAKTIWKHLQHQPILIWHSGLDTALILWSENHIPRPQT